jgi:hypothetical protein
MAEFVFYEEGWNIREREIHEGGVISTGSSSYDTEGSRR